MAADDSHTLDLRGLKCPLPVLRARKALERMTPRDVLVVECTDPMAAIDIPHFVTEAGHRLEGQVTAGDVLVFHIRKAAQ
ncbi:MAG: sulfurtransferase TusA family protein [Hyphomicrobiales bacterium]|nr:sulfurtransferase TusA family protein [Hyphomicrobiales bacterium]